MRCRTANLSQSSHQLPSKREINGRAPTTHQGHHHTSSLSLINSAYIMARRAETGYSSQPVKPKIISKLRPWASYQVERSLTSKAFIWLLTSSNRSELKELPWQVILIAFLKQSKHSISRLSSLEPSHHRLFTTNTSKTLRLIIVDMLHKMISKGAVERINRTKSPPRCKPQRVAKTCLQTR